MILGIGIDIVETTRIAHILDCFKESFLEKIFTRREVDNLGNDAVVHHAGKFAVKEAGVKSLSIGFADGVSFKHIEVVNDAKGAPKMHFYGNALERAKGLGIKRAHVSISQDHSHTIAMVILED